MKENKMPLDGYEASLLREVVILDPLTSESQMFRGSSVYSVTPLGIVVAVGKTHIFYPWHRIHRFNYHFEDLAARQVIQGF
jgi:hypothetical protein